METEEKNDLKKDLNKTDTVETQAVEKKKRQITPLLYGACTVIILIFVFIASMNNTKNVKQVNKRQDSLAVAIKVIPALIDQKIANNNDEIIKVVVDTINANTERISKKVAFSTSKANDASFIANKALKQYKLLEENYSDLQIKFVGLKDSVINNKYYFIHQTKKDSTVVNNFINQPVNNEQQTDGSDIELPDLPDLPEVPDVEIPGQ